MKYAYLLIIITSFNIQLKAQRHIIKPDTKKSHPDSSFNCPEPIISDTYSKTTTEDPNIIYTSAEKLPEFPGGTTGFNKFLQKKLKWPNKTGFNDIQGKVWITFVVEKNGKLSGVQILRSLDPDFDTEALRVINLSPRWRPGTRNGKPVRVQYSLPIPFKRSD